MASDAPASASDQVAALPMVSFSRLVNSYASCWLIAPLYRVGSCPPPAWRVAFTAA
jgi:hypothetical protein